MASSQERALQTLSAELARLDRQITALLKKQDELLRQKSKLEAAREVSPSVVAPASSFRAPGDAVLTPAPHGPWERQRRRGPCRPTPPPQPIFASGNRFAALSTPHTPSPTSRASSPPPAPAPRTSSPAPAPRASPPAPAPRRSSQDSVYVIGSSIVCHVQVKVRNTHATVSCFPGARVLDIAKRLPSALRRNVFGTVVIHVGTNDILDRRSEVLKEHYQTLLDTARKKTDARIVISGPLPTYRRGSERFSRLFALQSWLRGWCALNGLTYVDNWASFWEQPALFRRDGLHPSQVGSVVLSRNIERAIR
ncbi:uncharacterized protein LOC118805159 [Colossoma macropomum]|uniref:uncharacterized protein LOC118805159 n=1 Tax=Colossoma macropomum TaxID=42526 RepID=UPI001864A8D9|nr:uncharacterized protein LOC118805159 [Colossoma macropomum]